jgi:D-alanyl-D-alanine-carboxypeptidase/D-alanyl-D-alanine-endopeptidase
MKRTLFNRLNAIAALSLLAAALCAPAQNSRAASWPDLKTADALGSDLFVKSGATGMVLLIVRGDELFFQGYGETAPGSHRAPDRRSVVRLCSLTKIFATDLLLKLNADRTVRLDDPLQRYAPTGAIVPRRGRPITLRDLATHTSGLPRELGNGPSGTGHFTFPDYRTRWRWLPHERLLSEPGRRAVYSNLAYDFLGDALSAAAHRQYAALLAQRTLTPLGMRETTYFPDASECGRLLKSAFEDGPCAVTEATAGSSGLYSTADDMEAWLKYLLQTQDPAAQKVYLLPAEIAGQKGLDHAGEPTGVGLGWIHIMPLDGEQHIVEKTGGGAGFETYIAISRERKTALFLAVTDGPVNTHLNVFNAANKLLLAVAGLPPLPPEAAVKRVARHSKKRR